MEITKNINWQQFTKGTRGKPNEQLFPRQLAIQLPKYVTHIIGEPKYIYGQQEQVTVRNHNKSRFDPGSIRPTFVQLVIVMAPCRVGPFSISEHFVYFRE